MVFSPNYEIVEIAEETLAVPVGEMANTSKDVFTFSNAAATLVKRLKSHSTVQELVNQLVDTYDVDDETANEDVKRFLSSLISYGLVIE